ncbi:hypothetical protein H5410_013024 [Solanum commersonii]|uniref:Uncharacterized protein n=1 Tax=Solanum commersonii TaxID=4109 RepID=A0A9J6ATC3_SOLCO|nr:hypothetical protein H5410_013024 [Solanum commersonii]
MLMNLLEENWMNLSPASLMICVAESFWCTLAPPFTSLTLTPSVFLRLLGLFLSNSKGAGDRKEPSLPGIWLEVNDARWNKQGIGHIRTESNLQVPPDPLRLAAGTTSLLSQKYEFKSKYLDLGSLEMPYGPLMRFKNDGELWFASTSPTTIIIGPILLTTFIKLSKQSGLGSIVLSIELQ